MYCATLIKRSRGWAKEKVGEAKQGSEGMIGALNNGRLTSFSFRSRASLAASRWAAFLASSSSLNFSSCANNWAEMMEHKEHKIENRKLRLQNNYAKQIMEN